ncbi:chymotrypsin-like elastase family member 2A [Galendromus occidentalis]|uniref:Chymotrypsin-like elastase family member 2A n=1 Tax=Galendromus occidentalis TaxID=34638 RepID=A0AAJ6VWH0_9ACAR|nr:chymotrypsin-like elastase family member 2A [Galendromus occidentalis]
MESRFGSLEFTMLLPLTTLALIASITCELHCGEPVVQPQLIDLNIIGGQEALPKAFPWQAGLYTKPRFNLPSFNHGSHFCGGALIDNRTVITAAHCLGMSISAVRVHLGSHQRSTKDDGEIFVDIKDVCPHPSWRGQLNDIGIVRLDREVTFTDAIRPICLPEPNEEVSQNDKLYVTGWGYTSSGVEQKPAEVLMQARQMQITKEQCRNLRPTNPEKLICTLHSRGSSCHGDSGGPLQIKRGKYWQLQGVVSGGPPICGTPDWPMYYTEVSKYFDWIEAYKKSPNPTFDSSICG